MSTAVYPLSPVHQGVSKMPANKKQPLFPPKTSRYGGARSFQTLHPRARDSIVSSSSSSTNGSDRSSSFCDDFEHIYADCATPIPSEISPHTLESMITVFSFDAMDCESRISTAWPHKSSYVVKELLQTESTYVKDLGEIIKGYLSPMYSYLLSSGESPNFIQAVFGNIIKVHQIHVELLEDLQNSCTEPQDFAMVFLRCDFLTQYSIYCTNYSRGNECLERSLREDQILCDFIERCQKEIGHSLPLSSHLIKPVQRILKYRLLLEELTKHFDPQHVAYSTVQKSLEKMSSVADQINAAFHDNSKGHLKAAPSTIAKRRTHQLNQLQKSRSLKLKKNSSPSSSPLHSRKATANPGGYNTIHSYTYYREPMSYHSPTSSPHRSPKRSLHPQRISEHSSLESETIKPSCCVSKENHRHSSGTLPCVHDLRNYFENLAQIASEEKAIANSRRASTTIKRAKSASGSEFLVGSQGPAAENPPAVKRSTSFGRLTEFRVNPFTNKLKRTLSQRRLDKVMV